MENEPDAWTLAVDGAILRLETDIKRTQEEHDAAVEAHQAAVRLMDEKNQALRVMRRDLEALIGQLRLRTDFGSWRRERYDGLKSRPAKMWANQAKERQ